MSYISDFQDAQNRSLLSFGSELNPNFPIQTEWGKSLYKGIKYAGEALASNFDTPDQLDSHCFLATMLTSVGLIDAKIRHSITIGDVEYDHGGRYTKATLDSLTDEINAGFNPKTSDGAATLQSANSHCWITLPNGNIIDPTIITHIDVCRGRVRKGLISFEKMIFQAQNPDSRVKRHIPLLTGLTYHMNVVTGISDELSTKEQFYDQYQGWKNIYLNFMTK